MRIVQIYIRLFREIVGVFTRIIQNTLVSSVDKIQII